ncbi:hypothetical protein FDP41_005083 [Naegleria fowleri]|uniref:Uncharacterized protein n=1 Tax=Naegleria fowleri TaxID=5763 RepID=A0A6A5BLH0_NAEFO|nr:uncharacterized protein FDP41_005083 [Naegleria fowleri]KAF0975756.1 hypothetical protein FDP41_005083 [Naegleria fowleri]CAG4719057.1 unnamed protein product [Naegleria fowleri]
MSFLYNIYYRFNPWPHRTYNEELSNELPALPVNRLVQKYSQYTFLGTKKNLPDPRFPSNNADFYKKCYLNFSVWRKCLADHAADGVDKEDPNAQICKRYEQLARFSCPLTDYENLLNQVEKDSFVAMLGFQPKYEGSSPTVLRVDHHNKVVKVLHSSKSNPYAEGDTYSRIRQYYFYK